MKTLIVTSLISLLSLQASASIVGNEHDDDRSKVANEVKALVVNQELFDVMNYSGELSISFTIDENDQIHVTEVVTDDYSLEYHVRRTLENAKVVASETLVGKTIALAIELVQSK
jgi:hypothetical protein